MSFTYLRIRFRRLAAGVMAEFIGFLEMVWADDPKRDQHWLPALRIYGGKFLKVFQTHNKLRSKLLAENRARREVELHQRGTSPADELRLVQLLICRSQSLKSCIKSLLSRVIFYVRRVPLIYALHVKVQLYFGEYTLPSWAPEACSIEEYVPPVLSELRDLQRLLYAMLQLDCQGARTEVYCNLNNIALLQAVKSTRTLYWTSQFKMTAAVAKHITGVHLNRFMLLLLICNAVYVIPCLLFSAGAPLPDIQPAMVLSAPQRTRLNELCLLSTRELNFQPIKRKRKQRWESIHELFCQEFPDLIISEIGLRRTYLLSFPVKEFRVLCSGTGDNLRYSHGLSSTVATLTGVTKLSTTRVRKHAESITSYAPLDMYKRWR